MWLAFKFEDHPNLNNILLLLPSKKILGETNGVTKRVRKSGNKNNYRLESIIFSHIMLYLFDDIDFEEYMYPYSTRT